MNSVNYRKENTPIAKSRVFCLLERISGYAAFILCTVGICLLDSPNPTLTIIFLGSGTLTAVSCFLFRKVSIYFRKEERCRYQAARRKEARDRIVFSGEYTKIA